MKATTKAKPVPPASSIADPAIRLLKTATCPSLTGKARLTYHVGCDTNGEAQFRIHANNGGGFFNDDWVSLSAIQAVFDKIPADKPITSFNLFPLFKGKSSNSPAFLLAALKQEGLVQGSKDKQRSYERCDPKGFLTGIKALMATAGTGKTNEKNAVPAKPETPAKKTVSKSTRRKKG